MSNEKTMSFHPAIPAELQAILALDMNAEFTPQVTKFVESLGDFTGTTTVVLPGQAVAAALMLPILEMSIGLPTMTLYGFGQQVAVTGELDLADYRHNIVRPRRYDVEQNAAPFYGQTILDGAGRGVTDSQLEELSNQLNCSKDDIRVIDISMGQVDPSHPEMGVADKLVAIGLNKMDWTSGRLSYLPAGFGPLAIIQATAIYAMSEAWPKVIRLNRDGEGNFNVAEIVDPQALRGYGVGLKAKWNAGIAPVLVPREILERIIALHQFDENGEGAELAEALKVLLTN